MACVKGTNNSETINLFDGVTFGDDVIWGYGGNDSIFGLAGDDYIVGGAGADALHGGPGSDTASYWNSTAGIMASLSCGVGVGGDAEGDTYFSIENLYRQRLRGRARRQQWQQLDWTDWPATTSSTAGTVTTAVWRIGQRHAQRRRRCRLARRLRGDRYGLLL